MICLIKNLTNIDKLFIESFYSSHLFLKLCEIIITINYTLKIIDVQRIYLLHIAKFNLKKIKL